MGWETKNMCLPPRPTTHLKGGKNGYGGDSFGRIQKIKGATYGDYYIMGFIVKHSINLSVALDMTEGK